MKLKNDNIKYVREVDIAKKNIKKINKCTHLQKKKNVQQNKDTFP